MKKGFTLTEVLVVIATVAALLPVVGMFFMDGWVASGRAIQRVENNQMISILMKQWQNTVHVTAAGQLTADGHGFSAGAVRCYQEGKHLVIDKGESKKSYFSLKMRSAGSLLKEAPALRIVLLCMSSGSHCICEGRRFRRSGLLPAANENEKAA